MHQDDDELIDSFVARLQIKVTKCEYEVMPVVTAENPTVTFKDLMNDFIQD